MPAAPAPKQFSWQEPWFFKLRTTTKTGWILRATFFIATYLFFVIAMFLADKRADASAAETIAKLLFPLLPATLFLTLFELPTLRRDITISDNGFSCLGSMAMFGGPIHLLTAFKHLLLLEIQEVHLLRPREPGNPFDFGVMSLKQKYSKAKLYGVPATLPLEQVANEFHSRNLSVQLSHWPPTPQTTS